MPKYDSEEEKRLTISLQILDQTDKRTCQNWIKNNTFLMTSFADEYDVFLFREPKEATIND
jgi:hypothetical protein